MNKEYFFFSTEEKARDFFINCLKNGIYVEFVRDEAGYFVPIDIEKTLEAKNAKTEN